MININIVDLIYNHKTSGTKLNKFFKNEIDSKGESHPPKNIIAAKNDTKIIFEYSAD